MKGMRIRPEKQGLKTSLFDLEADIMVIVWSKHWEIFSVGDVHVILDQCRNIAYTTVMTTVSRLYDKGLLERKKDGKRYLYVPKMSREEFLVSTTREIMERLPPLGQNAAMALLVERVSEADESALDQLESLIRLRRSGGIK